MAKRIILTCDRCHSPLTPNNWMLDEEICNDCILLSEIAATAAKRDTIALQKPGTAIAQWNETYKSSSNLTNI